MARKQIRINHPSKPPGPGSQVPATFFVAFGDAAAKVREVVGVVLHAKHKPVFGVTLAGPPHWSIAFMDLPVGNCELVVLDPYHPRLFAVRPFIVKRAGYAVQIYYPGNNQTVCNNFTAYGYASQGVTSVQGAMTSNGGTVTNGTVLQQPGPTSLAWAISFAFAAPYDNPYSLCVTGSDGSSSTHSGLTIQTC